MTLLMAASFLFCSLSAVGAEETDAPKASETSSLPNATGESDLSFAGDNMTPVLPSGADLGDSIKRESPQLSKSAVPVLTVNAISNYFGKAYAEYNEYTKEVIVSYRLKASKRLMSADWTLTYDETVLGIDPNKNSVESICPTIGKDALVDFDEEGMVSLYATSLDLYDFSAHETVFAQIVFDVKELNIEEPEITKVDLTVNNLWVSEPNPATGKAIPGKEIVLVSHSEVIENDKTESVLVSKVTSLTSSTFNELDYTRASADQAVSVATTAATTAPPPPPKPVATQPQPPQDPKKEARIWVQTGKWYMATLILGVLFACSTVLFVMRKRDIYDD